MSVLTVLPVIMAGGSGTRLWPLSRALYPKQFLALSGPQTLFQQAHLRLTALASEHIAVGKPCVVGNEEHRFLVLDQLRELKAEPSSLLLEPVGRNTAPAVALAALQATADGQDPILVVTPADQTVTRPEAYTAALRTAIEAAAGGDIVILGITPDRPETGFGYIRTAAPAADGTRGVQAFVEKPDLDTAKAYLAEGSYYWNSGMFVMRASRWLAALAHFRPDIAQATQASFDVRTTDASFVRPGKAEFERVPSESVDYAVMEQCPSHPEAGFTVKMVPLDAGWSDLGAWDAVWQVSAQDASGNASEGDALIQNSRNTLVHSTSRLVAAVGLDNVVVVETPDAVLVADRSRSQDVKNVVAALSKQERSEGSLHRRVHRPWGWYDSIDHGPRFQVKRIMVKPKASLSLQMHHHRAEHWIVVSGTAEVTVGDKVIMLSENQSTYIPLGTVHRLVNPGTIPLEIIEVQSGSYLGEDDIVRFQDNYGRSS
ncbi:MAG TPA: mannose-1-phosphate guanylyltransferase/mannose-6-phosphate isomerase [Aquabacterium sp.]|uniref:mannose-1-phosphate guanylyltransferase/mannose-6-phosphate isomerase n=1 Tax=Aquabacterium sp. TaxID=1872578 RepID=UPI002E321DFE|nr:mannose-1-phosphate guanylyltransferase/mannose-6-phosphate isomerase [Aquabacterium sp.]HEX5374013.1 mannose-1-phosphate guanylyltransferase/mannose-6-phosphate isomerase [Aquabacterium sp.]